MDTDIRAILSAIPRGEEAARLPHQELVQVLDSVVSIALLLARQVEILQEEKEPAGTGSGSDRTGQDLARAELCPLAQVEHQFWQLGHSLFQGSALVHRQPRQCWHTNRQ